MAGMTEDDLEQILLGWLDRLGWAHVYGPDIAPGEAAAERADYRETVLERRLLAAVTRLNPHLPPDAVAEVIRTVQRAESPVVESENWRCYRYLIEGVPVEYRDADGALRTGRARLVDWDSPWTNDLVAVNQFTILGPKHKRRPDIILFVNGLPMAVFELKRTGKKYAPVSGGYQQIQTYRAQVPDLFRWNQICVATDGISARSGSFSAPWNHWAPWKTINGQNLKPRTSDGFLMSESEVLTKGLFRTEVFFDLVHNFIATYGEGEKTQKRVAKYHQYWAVNKAVERTIEAVEDDGRIGVVWHTQGSGKSMEMCYYAGKVMRHPAMENPTLVVLTDRNDLDGQLLNETFAPSRTGSPLPEKPVQADSREHLKDLLRGRESGGLIFTTIQKFGLSKEEKDAGRSYPLLSERTNIVVMVDEAHRSNYDTIDGFARHMRDGLPGASFIGFTGTPIDEKDRSTLAVFGEYIDIYDMTQAQDDGATVKVYYEPRLASVALPEDAREAIDDEVKAVIDGGEDDDNERLKSKWAKVEAIVGSEQRIAELASDIVEHWETRREVLAGKAMIVTMSRRIAVDLYNAIVALRPDWHHEDDDQGLIKVVMTGSASDRADFQPHIRNNQAKQTIKTRASDPTDPLELVIVRDMWLTGFDSPPMHTMYVDKPMQGASLMQAITRVNRTFRDKPSGLVVDYIGIAEDLKNALQTYTKRDKDRGAIGDDVRQSAIPELLAEHSIVSDLLHGVDWVTILGSGSPQAFLHACAAAVDHLLESEERTGEADDDEGWAEGGAGDEAQPSLKKRFLAHTRRLKQLFVLVPGAPESVAIRDDVQFFDAVRESIAKLEGADKENRDDDVSRDTAMRQILSQHMAGGGVIDIYAEAGLANPDISLIDDEFAEKFRTSDNKTLQLEMIKRLINSEVKVIGKRNVVAGREFSDMLAAAMNRYQNRAIDAAQVVAEIVAIAKAIREKRAAGDESGLTENEIAFYDALASNDSARQMMQDETMRKIAHELTEIVRKDAKTDWNVKETVRAKLRTRIKRLLLQHGYPPDLQQAATDLILEQAEVMADADD